MYVCMYVCTGECLNLLCRYKQFERVGEVDDSKEEVDAEMEKAEVREAGKKEAEGRREDKRKNKQDWWTRHIRKGLSPAPPSSREATPTSHLPPSSAPAEAPQEPTEQPKSADSATAGGTPPSNLTPPPSKRTPPSDLSCSGRGYGSSGGGGGGWREGSGTRIHSGTVTLEDMDGNPPRAGSEERFAMEMGYEEVWLNAEQQTDCMDPIKHQGISVLFSNTCRDRQKHQQRPCLSPW